MAQLQITTQDGLLACDAASTAPFLDWNPLQFHSEFHRICQQLYVQLKPDAVHVETQLQTLGYDTVTPCISPETARGLSRAYDDMAEGSGTVTNAKLEPSTALRARVIEILNECLDAALVARIESYLGCFFRIDHVELMRSRAAGEPGKSYYWHRDFDPMSKLHLLIYLTDCGPDSPATIFTTFEDTRRCARLGYSFPPRSQRIADLDNLFDDDDEPVAVHRPSLAAGDATLFAPSRILHRGDIPGDAHRDLLILNILPSMNPWNLELEKLGAERLFDGRGTLFYDPFTREKPSIEWYDGVEVPLWAEQSYPFPLT